MRFTFLLSLALCSCKGDTKDDVPVDIPTDPTPGTTTGTVTGTSTSTGVGGPTGGPSTTACDPVDPGDVSTDGTGDTCDLAVVTTAVDDTGSSIRIKGNAHEAGDIDWFLIEALDLGNDESWGFENFRLLIELAEGEGAYHFTVFRGDCYASQECDLEVGYETYEFFNLDDSYDEYGNLPADLRACGDAPLNQCPDYTGFWLLRVMTVDGAEHCDPYAIDISNGVW